VLMFVNAARKLRAQFGGGGSATAPAPSPAKAGAAY